ncbi:MAG: type II secretion system GspH family protein [Acetatifactor sp.]|nr:type II secretion system GspH family protein [Acetatifactor sp.]MDE6702035.1 type II secretion system GspH family protein [Acetatifactor sp.]MDE7114490.1 type II secretion system GspH family protein [Acetatifactor sp.]
MKKMNNKGFSLVELIIVIAIMAVLMGVLAPQLLKYVEDSRAQTDLSAMSEIENATKIALSIEDIYNSVSDGTTVTIANGAQVASSDSLLQAELLRTCPDAIKLTSKTWGSTGGTITINFDAAAGTFKLTNSWTTATP